VSARYCRCGHPLASDNTGLCAGCQARRRRDRAPDVPPEFWQTEVMTDALASGDVGRVIRAYRCHPFHGHRLPQTLVAGWLHMSQAAVCRIETGRRRLTIDEVRYIAQVLGMPVAAVPWTPQHEAREDVDPIKRRSLLGAGLGATFGLSYPFNNPRASAAIDSELVSHWMKLMSVLTRHDAMFGPRDVLDTVRHELGVIAEHRRVARGELRTQLFRVESRWSWFASWLGRDTGAPRLADECADRALRLAHEANYPSMVAYVLMRRSLWASDAHAATALARAARRTPGASDQVRALSALRMAYGSALAGDAMACERSLADAYGLLERPRDGRTALWDDLGDREVSRPYVLAEEARCWMLLRPTKAVDLFGDVVRLWPRDRMRGHGIHQAHLAVACALAGEPERAATEGVKALDIARMTGSDVTARELGQLDRHLDAFDVPAAADFRERFTTL
jgi:hypothetical protein